MGQACRSGALRSLGQAAVRHSPLPRGCRSLGPGGAGQGRGARQLLRKWQAGERGSPVIIKEQRCRGSLRRPLGQAG